MSGEQKPGDNEKLSVLANLPALARALNQLAENTSHVGISRVIPLPGDRVLSIAMKICPADELDDEEDDDE